MPSAGRNPSNKLDERLFPTVDVLERPAGERPQHQTLESIMDWLAGPARLAPSLLTNLMNSRGVWWRPGFRYYGRHFSGASPAISSRPISVPRPDQRFSRQWDLW